MAAGVKRRAAAGGRRSVAPLAAEGAVWMTVGVALALVCSAAAACSWARGPDRGGSRSTRSGSVKVAGVCGYVLRGEEAGAAALGWRLRRQGPLQ